MIDSRRLVSGEKGNGRRCEEPAQAAAATSKRHDIKPVFVVLCAVGTDESCSDAVFDGWQNLHVESARIQAPFYRRQMAHGDAVAFERWLGGRLSVNCRRNGHTRIENRLSSSCARQSGWCRYEMTQIEFHRGQFRSF